MAEQKDREVIFLGAGPGDPELLTLKGLRLLKQADTVIFAGSLVNPLVLEFCHESVELIDSAPLCLDDIVELMAKRARAGKSVVRLHSGDPAFYGAIAEQMARLREMGIDFSVVPGVSSLAAGAAALESELTLPEVSQTVIVTRAAGRTPVPPTEALDSLAAHQVTMAIFLSSSLAAEVQAQLLKHYPAETPVAVVQRASWPDQKILRTTVDSLAATMKEAAVSRTAIIYVGAALAGQGEESHLYARGFSHGYRRGEGEGDPA